jgi:hypothetical protein
MSSDEAVTHAIATVFRKFDELGTARQVFIWWMHEGLQFPVRRVQGRSHPVEWVQPVYPMLVRTLRNPVYAGAYVFGRSDQAALSRTVALHLLDPIDVNQIALYNWWHEKNAGSDT